MREVERNLIALGILIPRLVWVQGSTLRVAPPESLAPSIGDIRGPDNPTNRDRLARAYWEAFPECTVCFVYGSPEVEKRYRKKRRSP